MGVKSRSNWLQKAAPLIRKESIFLNLNFLICIIEIRPSRQEDWISPKSDSLVEANRLEFKSQTYYLPTYQTWTNFLTLLNLYALTSEINVAVLSISVVTIMISWGNEWALNTGAGTWFVLINHSGGNVVISDLSSGLATSLWMLDFFYLLTHHILSVCSLSDVENQVSSNASLPSPKESETESELGTGRGR